MDFDASIDSSSFILGGALQQMAYIHKLTVYSALEGAKEEVSIASFGEQNLFPHRYGDPRYRYHAPQSSHLFCNSDLP